MGNTASGRQENVIVNESTSDRDFTVGTSDKNLVTIEKRVEVNTLEK